MRILRSTDERGVSAVIAVILMVGMTVLIASVIAIFVLDLGDEGMQSPPEASFEYDVDKSGSAHNVTVTHKSGDEFEADRIVLQGPFNESEETWGTISGNPDGTINAGSEIILHNVSGEIKLLWLNKKGEGEAIINRFDPSSQT